MMDIGKSFTYVFEDKDWVTKVLIGGLLTLIPIVNLVVIGYALRVTKNVADGLEQPLPNWDDLGDYFVKGFMATLGSLVWALPMLLFGLVMAILSAFGVDSSSQQESLFSICALGTSCVMVAYGFLVSALLPAAYARYATTGEFVVFFQIGKLFRFIGANLGNYIVALLLTIVASFIAGFGMILCFVGIFFTEFWATLVTPHLLGQICRESAGSTIQAPPIVEPPTV